MKLELDLVETAIVTLLTTALAADNASVDGLSEQDLDQEGNVLTRPPYVRIYLDGEQLGPGRDNQQLTYQAAQNWKALVGVANLRARSDERRAAYQLLTKTKDALAGARLQLDANTKTPPVQLGAIQVSSVTKLGSVYALAFTVQGIAQFSGANANP